MNLTLGLYRSDLNSGLDGPSTLDPINLRILRNLWWTSSGLWLKVGREWLKCQRSGSTAFHLGRLHWIHRHLGGMGVRIQSVSYRTREYVGREGVRCPSTQRLPD